MTNQYALAFFEIAKEDNNLELCKESFDVFMKLLETEKDFKSFLSSFNIKADNKKDLVKKVLKNCSDDFIYFLYVILDNNRIDTIDSIYDSFTNLYNEEHKIKNVMIFSVELLNEKEKTVILDSLKKRYEGYKFIINNKIDPNTIGGYHILVNGVSIDLSIRRKIKELETFTLK